MEILVGKITSDKKVAEFFIGDVTDRGYYHPHNQSLWVETKVESQCLDPQKTKLSKKDYSRLLRKAFAILAKR